MYYFIFSLFYLISLLPMVVLYRLSDLSFFILCYIVRYRRKVILHNLSIAFPDKNLREKKKIARRFYKNLCDTFIETIKLLSITDAHFSKMVIMHLDECIELAKSGKNIQFHAGHQFNWELANWKIAEKMPIPFVGVYMKLSNKALNKLFYDLRSKKGTVLVATHEFRNRMHLLLDKQYSIGLAADQNPSVISNSYWLNFFNHPTPFVTGPDKAAIKNNTAVVFVKLIKIRRGKYRFDTKIITENAANMKDGALTLLYRDFLEETIMENPDNYLWSHRRWRWENHDSFKDQWIDHRRPFEKN